MTARSILAFTTVAGVLMLGAPARAQVIGGRVVDSTSRKPISRVSVQLVDVSGISSTVVAETDSAGEFYLDAPRAGRYRLFFKAVPNDWMFGDSVGLAAGDFVQRQYVLNLPRDPVFLESEVDKPVAPAPGNKGPLYPRELREAQQEGEVRVQFVVDTTGRAEPKGIKILASTHPFFTVSVQNALLEMTFVPAEYNGHRVRQRVEQPFRFCLGLNRCGVR